MPHSAAKAADRSAARGPEPPFEPPIIVRYRLIVAQCAAAAARYLCSRWPLVHFRRWPPLRYSDNVFFATLNLWQSLLHEAHNMMMRLQFVPHDPMRLVSLSTHGVVGSLDLRCEG